MIVITDKPQKPLPDWTLAEVAEHTLEPDGGEIGKDKRGKLTGVISEKTLNLIFSRISIPDDELIKAAVKALQDNLGLNEITLTYGNMSVHLVRFTPVPYIQYPYTVQWQYPPTSY